MYKTGTFITTSKNQWFEILGKGDNPFGFLVRRWKKIEQGYFLADNDIVLEYEVLNNAKDYDEMFLKSTGKLFEVHTAEGLVFVDINRNQYKPENNASKFFKDWLE